MYDNDYIMRQILSLGNILAKLIFGRDAKTEQIIYEDITESGLDPVREILSNFISARQINEAESFLFEMAEERIQYIPENAHNPLLSLGAWFYMRVSELSDEELEAADFTRGEIVEGLKDFSRLIE